LFVSDWYDPGVGGHHVGDLAQGRIYRIAPPRTPYVIPAFDLDTPEGAVEALRSPNIATRYLAWTAAHAMGEGAEPALAVLRDDADPRLRARALWLLGRIPGRATSVVESALADVDEDVRIAGLRLARQLALDLVPYLNRLVDDPSPAMRREAALALRHLDTPESPALWARLAARHDGTDRWYLEALGIGADRQWDTFFAAWREQNRENWDTPAGRDIVWRARTEAALPLLAELIVDPNTPPAERLRYFRALDFHPDSPTKRGLLDGLLAADHPDRLAIRVHSMLHLADAAALADSGTRRVLDETLAEAEGTRAFVDLVNRFELADRAPALFDLAMADPAAELGLDAGRVLLEMGVEEPFVSALADTSRSKDAIALLAGIGSSRSRQVMEASFLSPELPLDVRRRVLERFGPGWSGESRILALLEEGRFPAELSVTASNILFASIDDRRRVRAEKFFERPAGTAGQPLPPIEELMTLEGDPAAGAETFAAAQCGSCHVVQGQGIDFGPSLTEIGGKLTPEALYTAILFPDAGVGFGYEGYRLRLLDGSEAVGYILNASGDEVALREAGGRTNRYAVSDIAEKALLGQSLMPSMARSLTAQQLADLVAYLSTLRSL
jgi:putative heme-binding domain-containing protein